MIECIAFKLNAFDTHKAYNEQTRIYTIVQNGFYVIKDSQGWKLLNLKHGDTLNDILYLVSESSGIFYESALNEINQKTDYGV